VIGVQVTCRELISILYFNQLSFPNERYAATLFSIFPVVSFFTFFSLSEGHPAHGKILFDDLLILWHLIWDQALLTASLTALSGTSSSWLKVETRKH